MATNNSVEYRATLDSSGVKTGAAEAAQAINAISGATSQIKTTGLDLAAKEAQELANSAQQATQAMETVGPAAAKSGNQVTREFDQAANSTNRLMAGANGTSQAMTTFSAQTATKELNQFGQTAGEATQALRYLPMQMTDVAVSLASGMPAYMVAIQQGGQLKDSFNGIGNAAKATTSYLLGAINPLALVATGAAVVALAYYQGSKEMDAYNQSVVMSGYVAGVSALQLAEMAKQVDAVTGTQAAAAPVLAQMASSGKIAGENLAQFTAMAVQMETTVGKAASETVKELEELGKKPTEAAAKLNEQYNFLTPAVYRQIRALEVQGKTEESAALAQKTYADAMSARAKQLDGELGYIERGWRGVKSAAAEAWDAMLNVGRSSSPVEQAGAQIEKLQKQISDKIATGPLNGVTTASHEKGLADLRQRLEVAQGFAQTMASVDKATTEALDRENKARQTGIDLQKESAKHATKAVKLEQELAAAREKYAAHAKTSPEAQKDYEQLIAGIKEKYKSSGGGRKGGIKVTDNELAGMQAQLDAAKQYYDQLVTLGAGAAGLNSAERESLKIGQQLKLTTDAKTIARLQEKQAVADTLAVQLRTNEGLEASYQAHAKAIEAVNTEAESITANAQRQEAANQVRGKGTTAIQEMTLAELERQMAEAQASDSFDPKYIAALETKIAAQKRYVTALKETDYKAISQHTDDLLSNAKDLAKVYADEQKLSNLTGLEREKIVAQRQQELKYAKELAKIDASALSDAEKQVEREKVLEAQRIESAAIVTKVTTEYANKGAEEINRSLTDALMRGFESGKSFAENFADTVQNLFNTMVLRPVISAVMGPVSGMVNGLVQNVLGAVGLGTGGGGGGGSGTLGTLGNLGSMGNTAYNAYTGQGVAGQAYNYVAGMFGYGAAPWGAAGVQASGAVTMPVTGSLGSTAPGSGASIGWGATAALAIPFIAAYLGGMFKDEKMVGSGLTGTLGGDMYGYQLMRESGGLFDGPDYRYLIAEKEIAETKAKIEAFKKENPGYEPTGDQFDPLQNLYAKLKRLETDYGGAIAGSKGPIKVLQDAFTQMREGTATQADALGLDGDKVRKMTAVLGSDEIHPDTGGLGLELTGLTQEEAAQKIADALAKANEEMARGVLGSFKEVTFERTTMVHSQYEEVMESGATILRDRYDEVTETVTEMQWVASEYIREGETAVAALTRMATGITVVNQVFDLLGASVLDASLANGDWSSKLVEAAGGLDKLTQAVSTYYDLYYSDDEKRGKAVSSANKGMEDKGLDLRVGDTDAKAKYRALVDKAIKDKDEALLAWLLEFADDFAVGADAAAAAVQAGSDAITEKLNEIARIRTETLTTLGLSMDGLVDGFITEINEGRGATAGAWLADTIAGGFEQAIYGQAIGIIMSSIIDGVVTPMVTAALTGSSITDAVTAAAIDNMVANANAALAALTTLLTNTEFIEGMEKIKVTITTLGNSIGASIPRMNSYQSSVVSTGNAADYAGSKIDKAADEAKKLADEWLRTIESMVDSVRGLRGEAAGSGQEGVAYWRAQLAIDTAAAKAGDKDAADRLTEIVSKLAELEVKNASSALDAQRAQAQLAQGLEDTARYLALKFGITVPGFASGGNHAGGLRIVGENGPELELTGASRIVNNGDLMEMLSGRGQGDNSDQLVAAVGRMRSDLLQAQLRGNKIQLDLLRLFESWDRYGMPRARDVMVTQ